MLLGRNDIEDELPQEEKYNNVPDEIIQFITDFFQQAKDKVPSDEGQRLIDLALINLQYHPLVPKTNCVIHLRYESISYSVIYTDYKIELSDYVSMDTGFGFDHFQTFKMCYYPVGTIETEGDYYKFEEGIINALEAKSEIEPSEEE